MSARQLKVGYVVKMFPRLSETFILNEILELERKGVEVTIFSAKRPNEGIFHPQLANLKADVLYLDEFDLRKWPAWLGKSWEALRDKQDNFWSLMDEALQASDRTKTDQVILGAWIGSQGILRGINRFHAHFATLPSTLALYASKISGIDFSLTAHAKDIYVYPFSETLMIEKIASSAQVVTVTHFNKKFIDERCPEDLHEKVVVLHNGINLDRFGVLGDSTEATSEEALIVGVGRLVPKKGFDTLLRACAILKERAVKFRCVIIGDGSESEALKALKVECNLGAEVDLHGAAHSGETLEWIQKATVTCLPCTTATDNNIDALPTALLESLACGVPAVSTLLSGIPEIIESGKEGFLVEPDDVNALADRLEELLKDKQLRDSFARNCRLKAEREFDIEKNVGRLVEYFSTSLQPSPTKVTTSSSSTQSDKSLAKQRSA